MSGALRELEPEGVAPSAETTPGLPRAPWWALAAAGLVVVVLLGYLAVDRAGNTSTAAPTTSSTSITEEPPEPARIELPPIEWSAGLTSLSAPDIAWSKSDLGSQVEIADLAGRRGTVVAVGRDRTGPAVWTSNVGVYWVRHDVGTDVVANMTTDLTAVTTSIDGFLAVGTQSGRPTVFRSSTGLSWDATAIDLGGDYVADFRDVAGDRDRFVAIVEEESVGLQLWASTGGDVWSEVTVAPDAAFERVTFDGGRFVLTGASCTQDPCVPAIWTSENGLAWVASILELPEGIGWVVDAATTDAGWIAVGYSRGRWSGHGGNEVLIWTSVDGVVWTLRPDADGAFTAPSLQVALVDIREVVAGYRAVLDVGGETIEAGVGDLLGNSIEVSEISSSQVTLKWFFADDTVLKPDEPSSVRFPGWVGVNALATMGERILVIGDAFDMASGVQETIAWTSVDGGATWARAALPSDIRATAALTFRSRQLVAGSSADASVLIGVWNTTAAANRAITAVRRLILAEQHHDPPAAIAALPATIPTIAAGAAATAWPSLLTTDLAAWYLAADGDVSSRDDDAIAAIVAYSEALHGRLAVGDCSATVRLPDETGASVSCDATYSDDLISTLYRGDIALRLAADVEGDAVVSLTATSSTSAWSRFARWLSRLHPQVASETLVAVPRNPEELLPAPTGRLAAQQHLAAARDLAANQLQPGDTLTTSGPFGTVEWSWGRPPSDATNFGEPSWTGDGFTLRDWMQPYRIRGWVSQDGRTWVDLPPSDPPDMERRLEVTPIGPVVTGYDWRQDLPTLRHLSGDSWVDVPFSDPLPGETGLWWIADVVADAEDLLVVTVVAQDLGEQDIPLSRVWRWNEADWSLVPVEVPWSLLGNEGVDLEIGPFGLLASVNQWTDDAAEIWVSEDGNEWRLAFSARDAGLAGLAGIAVGSDRVVVLARSGDEICRPMAVEPQGYDRCTGRAMVVVSTDGIAWETAAPAADLASDEFTRIVSGPLGFAAWADGIEPAAQLWLSADGIDWQPIMIEPPWDPGGSYPNVAGVAVGDDAVLALYVDNSFANATPRILVGRTVAGDQ